LYVLCLHVLSQSPSGQTKVLLFFWSTARFLLGPTDSWLSWLSLFEASPNQQWWQQCAFPTTTTGLPILQLPLPFISLLIPLWLFRATRCSLVSKSSSSVAGLFLPVAFIRTALSLIISSFTTITTVVFDTLLCVSVNGQRVVFVLPALSCDGHAYNALEAVMISVVILWLLGIPLAMGLLVHWQRKRQMSNDTQPSAILMFLTGLLV